MTGRIVHTYEIGEPLGEGGMGTVYRGVDRMLEREVAVKVLRPELTAQPHLLQRFRAEAVTLGGLAHPAIATLYAFLQVEHEHFMVMEYVPGETLEDRLKREGALAPADAVRLMRQVLDGIAYAHRQGVVHRDLKPANLMIRPDGAVKIMDFGIARALGATRMTRTGFLIGTLEYMAPEQIRGADVDGRTDLYALATVLYEMLSGQVPFEAASEYALMQAQVQAPPPPLRARVHGVPGLLADAVMAGLEKQPADRPATAEAFRDRLTAALAATPEPGPAAQPKATRLAGAPAGQRAATAWAAVRARLPRVRLGVPSTLPLRTAGLVTAAVVLVATTWLAARPLLGPGAPPAREDTPAAAESTAFTPLTNAPDDARAGTDERRRAAAPPAFVPPPRQRAEVLPLPNAPEPERAPERRATPPRRADDASRTESAPRLAPLRIVVHPFGDVFIDGDARATGRNAHTERLAPGTYRVRVVHPVYGAWEKRVRLPDGGGDVVFNFKAEHAVTVTSDPPNAEIYVDGRATGRYTPARLALPPGERVVAVRRPGYAAPEARRFTLDGDLDAPLHFSLTSDRPQP